MSNKIIDPLSSIAAGYQKPTLLYNELSLGSFHTLLSKVVVIVVTNCTLGAPSSTATVPTFRIPGSR